mmetsp:Transcript_113/g.344  ORF Transcript_113/g.344 Transcript_113/m.344 type:complete len:215 (+) Transcript_113:2498-3142(+)
MPVQIDQDITSLDVPVDEVVLVHVVHRLEDLAQDARDPGLLQAVPVRPLHNAQHGPPTDIWHHHPEHVLLGHEGAIKVEDVRVLGHPHCLRLAHDLLQVRVHNLQLYGLHGDYLVQRPTQRSEDLCRHALADHVQDLVVRRRGRVVLLGRSRDIRAARVPQHTCRPPDRPLSLSLSLSLNDLPIAALSTVSMRSKALSLGRTVGSAAEAMAAGS